MLLVSKDEGWVGFSFGEKRDGKDKRLLKSFFEEYF